MVIANTAICLIRQANARLQSRNAALSHRSHFALSNNPQRHLIFAPMQRPINS